LIKENFVTQLNEIKKLKKLILSLLITLLLLTGCLNYVQNTTIYPDGSGNMQINYWMKFSDTSSVATILTLEIFNPDSIRREFSSEFIKIIDVVTYSDTIDSTVHANIELSFNFVDSLNTANAFAQSRFLLEDGASGQKIFSQFIPPVTTGFGMDGSAYQVTYNYDIRGEIITHNATNKSGNNLTWSYSLSEIGRGKTISVTFMPFKLKETPYWIYILAGLVLLIVIFFLLRKRKD
jgi:LPXTG-motif cell wall-anchored protein